VIASVIIIAGLIVLAGLWSLLWEDRPLVHLLDATEAAACEALIRATRERERRSLRVDRYWQTRQWDEVGYPDALWRWRGIKLGLIQESPHPAEQNLEPSTGAAIGWKMSRQPSTN